MADKDQASPTPLHHPSDDAALNEYPIDGIAAQLKKSNLTQAQLLLWMGQKLNPDAPLYNMVVSFAIDGEVDPIHLGQAFQSVVNDSNALRAIFEEVDGVPQLRTLEELSVQLDVVDLSGEANPHAALQEWTDDRCQRNLDLGECLFDSALIKLAEGKCIWYLNQHHLITDAWSFALVYRRISEIYYQSINGSGVSQSPLPSFQKYSEFEGSHRGSPIY